MRILYSNCLDFYFDQLNTSSCSANAMTIILFLLMKKYNIHPFICSRLFIYYNGREFNHQIDRDEGLTNKALFYSLHKYGICPESLCPYDITKVKEKPKKIAYEFASRFPVEIYFSEQYLFQGSNWIEFISKTLLNRQFILISIKRDDETSSSFNPVGPFNTFPIVDYIKYYHHIICIGIDTDEKLLYLLNSYGQRNNNVVTISFHEIEKLNPLEPDLCIIDADFSQCKKSTYYEYSFDKSHFFSYSENNKNYMDKIKFLQPIFNKEFGSQWCFHHETELFLLYDHYQPQEIPIFKLSKIHVIVPSHTEFKHPDCLITINKTIMRKYLLFCISIHNWNNHYDKIIKTICSYHHKVLILTNKKNIQHIPQKECIQTVLNSFLDAKIITNSMKLFSINDSENVFIINNKTFLNFNNINGALHDILFRIYDTILYNNYNIQKFNDFPILKTNLFEKTCKDRKLLYYWNKIMSNYKSCIFNLKIPFETEKHDIDTEIYYDHVILGTELTSRYLAYRLREKFPNDSILLLEENMYENNSICFFDKFALPFKNVHTIHDKNLLSKKIFHEFNIPLQSQHNLDNNMILTEDEKKCLCKIIFKNYTIDVEFLFHSDENINKDRMYLILESLSNIEELCCTNDHDYFNSYGMDISCIKSRETVKYFESISEVSAALSHEQSAFEFIVSCLCLSSTVYAVEEQLQKLQEKMTGDFTHVNFGSFLMGNTKEQFCLVDQVSIYGINDNLSTVSTGIRIDNDNQSSLFSIHFKELYNCIADPKLLPKCIVTTEMLSLHICFPKTSFNCNYFTQQNTIYYLDRELIWITLENKNEFISTLKKTFFLLHDFYYLVSSIPSIHQILADYIPILNENSSFIGFVITSQNSMQFSTKDSFYKNLLNLIGSSSTIHHFPMNVNFVSNIVESSFYIVDTFFSTMKRIGSMETGIHFVGFELEPILENCHFIYCSTVRKTKEMSNLFKPIILYGDAFHHELLLNKKKIETFHKFHKGYFDVYCSLTNRVKQKGLYFNNEKGILYETNHNNEIYTVLTYYIWEGKKFIASIRHRYEKTFGFEYYLFHSHSKEYRNQISFLKSLEL